MASKFKLGVVDEQKDDVDDFKAFFEDHFDVIEVPLATELSEMTQNVIASGVDAVAIDYKLQEHSSGIPFNGNELFSHLLDEMEEFPVFLMTAHPQEATKHHIDPFRIFPKEIMQSNPEKKFYDDGQALINKLTSLIKNYKEVSAEYEQKIDALLTEASKRELSPQERQDLIRYDTQIERRLGKKISVPDELKQPQVEEKLSKLIERADELLKRIDDKK